MHPARLRPRLRVNTPMAKVRRLGGCAQLRHGGGGVVTEDAVDPIPIFRQRQSQPKQHDMISALGGAPEDSVQRNTHVHHPVMNAPPIGCGIAGKDIVGAHARDLLSVDLVEAGPGEPERSLGRAVPKIDQPEMGKQARNFERIEVRSGRHAPSVRRPEPVIEDFALTLHDKLGPKGACGQHFFPPPQGRE